MLRRFFPGRQTADEDASRFTTVNPMTASFPRAQAGPGAEGSAAAEAEDLSARAPSAGLATRLIGNPAFGAPAPTTARAFGPTPPIPGRFAPAAASVAAASAAATADDYSEEDLARDMLGNERGDIVFPEEQATEPNYSQMSMEDRLRQFQSVWTGMPRENRDIIRAFFTLGRTVLGDTVSFRGRDDGSVEMVFSDEDNDEASVDDPSGQAQAIARQQGQADDMAEDPTGAGKRALLNRRRQELMALKHRR